ncbi:unnamed protein product [Mesocestoides corti]|uniref:Uncharacterized protein n=1 Tax=Mesocestoides corti TaxID=53468 RepID=A0A3P6GQ96_MESCO|nr:unnamed protein product [Mesocestoides corti]
MLGILLTQFRTRAPGARIFPQLMLARFGKRVHLLFCILTILNNISIITSVVNSEFIYVCQIVLNELPKSCVVGAFGSFVMALYWDNLTEPAVFIGSLMSSTLAVTTWFTLNLLHKYWADFPLNITEVGIVSDSFGILCSFMLPAAIVFATKINKPDSFTMEETQLTWKRTLQLGDPINPWMHTYAQTFRFPLSQSSQLTVAQVNAAMQPSRRVAAVGTALYFALFTLLLGLGCIPETLSLDGFRAWVGTGI